tara:strand:- start:980 stop:1702 length:723 start_codon:yes stop_codon:yes gene_type:complete
MCDSYQELLQCSLGVTAEALSIVNLGKMLNERYLHHHMSHRLQEQCGLLELHNPGIRPLLHPEWPTWKKSTKLQFGKYIGETSDGKATGRYNPATQDKGSAGFIDFALGDYDYPSIAIEVTTKHAWKRNEVVFDLMKLSDGRNKSFKAVISCNIILRENGLAEGRNKTRLKQSMKDALAEARNRLGDHLCNDEREKYFVVSEIAFESRRYWFYDCDSDEFVETEQLPPFLAGAPANGIGQ